MLIFSIATLCAPLEFKKINVNKKILVNFFNFFFEERAVTSAKVTTLSDPS